MDDEVSLIVLRAPLVSVTKQTRPFEMEFHEPACHRIPYTSHELYTQSFSYQLIGSLQSSLQVLRIVMSLKFC